MVLRSTSESISKSNTSIWMLNTSILKLPESFASGFLPNSDITARSYDIRKSWCHTRYRSAFFGAVISAAARELLWYRSIPDIRYFDIWYCDIGVSLQKVNNNEAFIISIARIKMVWRIQYLAKIEMSWRIQSFLAKIEMGWTRWRIQSLAKIEMDWRIQSLAKIEMCWLPYTNIQ